MSTLGVPDKVDRRSSSDATPVSRNSRRSRVSKLDRKYRSEAEVELLRKMNSQVSDAMNQPDGMVHKLHFRRIPKLFTCADYGFESDVYEAAANIFQSFMPRNTDLHEDHLISYWPPGRTPSQMAVQPKDFLQKSDYESERRKLQTYQLAFRTLKYQRLFEQVLLESGHLRKHPVDDEFSALLMVMLTDFQSRDFAMRPDVIDDEVPDYLRDIENSLYENKISLAAALARARVKHQARDIDYILPKALRNHEHFAEHLPQYFWVNTMKTTIADVEEKLQTMGFEEYHDTEHLLPDRGMFYRLDANCNDVLCVPRDQREILNTSDLVINWEIILQDKTSALAVLTMESLYASSDEIEVIHTDVSSGLTTAHLAVSLYRTSKKRNETRKAMIGRLNFTGENKGGVKVWDLNKQAEVWIQPNVYAFGVTSEEHRLRLEAMFEAMEISNVELIRGPFASSTNYNDPRFARVKSILITPQCTRSAIVDPIDFMLTEGDTKCVELLKEFSTCTQNKRASLCASTHLETVKAAMQYKMVTSCVYVTRSRFNEENEDVLNDGLSKQHNANGKFKLSPPTISLTSHDVHGVDGIFQSSILNGKFLKINASDEMNGCFIGVFVRTMEYPLKYKESKKSAVSDTPRQQASIIENAEGSESLEDERIPGKRRSSVNKPALIGKQHLTNKSPKGKKQSTHHKKTAFGRTQVHNFSVDTDH